VIHLGHTEAAAVQALHQARHAAGGADIRPDREEQIAARLDIELCSQ
jgi:hypothetical protein